MKKGTATILVLAFIFFAAAPGFAADYRQTALDYLTEKLQLPEQEIQIYEGGIFELEYIKESFWGAKYEVIAEGTPKPEPGMIDMVPPVTEPANTGDTPKPLPLDDPDQPVSSTTTPGDTPQTHEPDARILPAPDEYTAGVVYIRVETDEILDEAAMETYYTQDRMLAEAEWEQLRKEAGKVNVNLYKKLKTASASEKFTVLIQPVFEETAELTQRYNDLKAAYPEFSEGMPALSEMFGAHSYRVTEPLMLPEGFATDDPAATEAASAVDLPAIQGSSSPAYEGKNAEVRTPEQNGIDFEKRQEFTEKLEAIRVDGLKASAQVIEARLTAMEIPFTTGGTHITAELTADQINEVAQLDEVLTVFDDMFYTTTESRSVELDSAAAAPGAINLAAGDTDPDPAGFPYAYLLLPVLCIVLAVVFYRKYQSIKA